MTSFTPGFVAGATLTDEQVAEIAAISGGDSPTRFSINQVAHGFSVGDPIYNNAGTWALAQADDPTKGALGLVSEVVDVDNIRITIDGEMDWTAHGLTLNTIHYLSDSVAGGLTTTAPAVSQPLVVPLTANKVLVLGFAARAAGGGGGPYTDTLIETLSTWNGSSVVNSTPTDLTVYDELIVVGEIPSLQSNNSSRFLRVDAQEGTSGRVVETTGRIFKETGDAGTPILGSTAGEVGPLPDFGERGFLLWRIFDPGTNQACGHLQYSAITSADHVHSVMATVFTGGLWNRITFSNDFGNSFNADGNIRLIGRTYA